MSISARDSQNRPAATPKSAAPKAVYFFDGGQIWSRLGGDLHSLSIGGAQGILADLDRAADPASRHGWRVHCNALRAEMTAAIASYQDHWRAALAAEPIEDALHRARELETI